MAAKGVAMITGASRGIGKATAIALAQAGYDLVLAARTLSPNNRAVENVLDQQGQPLAGSLEQTETEVKALGSNAISVPLDLLDKNSMNQAIKTATDHFGTIDILINNAIYQGPGLMSDLLKSDFADIEKTFDANVLAQLYLVRALLPDMLMRGSGTIINLTSEAGMVDPPLKLADGGWSFAHGATKAALHRMAGILHLEYHEQGIRAYNVEPGLVASESMIAVMGEVSALETMGIRSAPVTVPAAVIRWLCEQDTAGTMSGQNIHAQPFCKQHHLLENWP